MRTDWLLGEQYNLASADQRMQKALEQYRNILYGEEDVTAKLNSDAENARCHLSNYQMVTIGR